MIRWIGRVLGFHTHRHDRMERDEEDGVLKLVCDDCGDRVPALRRSPEDSLKVLPMKPRGK